MTAASYDGGFVRLSGKLTVRYRRPLGELAPPGKRRVDSHLEPLMNAGLAQNPTRTIACRFSRRTGDDVADLNAGEQAGKR
jgi:hypothetical protein